MAKDQITLIVPAKNEYAKTVRMTAAALASRIGMTYDEVEDVRMAADEAFVYASDTLSDDAEIHFVFLLGEDDIEIDVVPRQSRSPARTRTRTAASPTRRSSSSPSATDTSSRATRTARTCASSSARGASMPVRRSPQKQTRKLSWDKVYTKELFRRYRANPADEAVRDELITMYLNLVTLPREPVPEPR